jgi:hypothetical protein
VINLKHLQKALTEVFGEPFNPTGRLTAKLTKDGKELRITVGPRDLWIDKTGKRTGSGMCL